MILECDNKKKLWEVCLYERQAILLLYFIFANYTVVFVAKYLCSQLNIGPVYFAECLIIVPSKVSVKLVWMLIVVTSFPAGTLS